MVSLGRIVGLPGGNRWRRGRFAAAVLAAAVLADLAVALPPGSAAAAPSGDAVRPKERSVPVGEVARREPGVPQSETARWSPSAVSWPKAAAGVVDVPGIGAGGAAGAGRLVAGTPVSVGVVARAATGAAERASRVRVEVLGRQAAQAAGVNALLLRLARVDGDAGPGAVSVQVDVSKFAGAFGGDWASRLSVVRFPGCVLTTPQRGECSTAVPEPSSVMDSRLMRLSADVVVGPPGGVAVDPRVAREFAGEAGAAEGEPVFGVMALGASSDTGDFSQTPMSPSSSWQAGDSGGEFAWSYDLRVPPVPGGLEPNLSLGYSSGAVDGQTAGKNVQPSWVGEGWDLQPGYVERAYRACADDVATGKEVLLHPGAGNGLFIGTWASAALRWPVDAGAVFSPGDLSGDGEVDVIYRDAQDKTLWMGRGNGSGGWLSEPGVLDAGDWSAAQYLFSPGDFSGDGRPDVMFRLASGQLYMRRGTAAGGLEATSVLVGSFGAANMIFSPGDFNGDGDVDVLWRRASDGALMAIWGNGNGGWVTGQSVVLGTGWNNANLFAAGDFSGDGKGDVVRRNIADNAIYLYKGNGTGGWLNGGSPTQLATGWGGRESMMITPDFDGDAKPDMMSSRVSPANPYYANATSDLCWRQNNARLVWGGRSTDLVLGQDGMWRPADDDGAKVELLTGAGNYENDGEHWRLTTVDGTQFYFGLNRLPNWSAGKRETHSAWNVPVFANHTGEPCFSTSGFVASRCIQTWRWNLDYVVDATGNSMAYFYQKDQGRTGLAGNANSVITYDRGGRLDRIEYGMRAGTELATATPPARVVFGSAERCLSACWSGTAWGSAPNTANWPDTPWDLHCATTATSCPNNISPTFFVTRRMTLANTQLWTGSGTNYTIVDQWDLAHQFPSTGNGTSPVLWLASITHTGKANGGNLALPALSFGGTRFDNRADYDPNAAMAQPRKYRITTVNTESGGQVVVTYSGTDPGCVFGSPFPNPEQNTKRCFPQWYKPQQAPAGWSWWHKYIVEAVTEKDLVGGSPDILTDYSYSTAGSSTAVLWGHDDGTARWSTPLARRSWGDWRGYPTVTVTAGPAGGTQTQTKHLYFRGLHGDYLAQGKPTRVATITNSAGDVWQDDPALAGMLHETIKLDGPGGAQLTRAVSDPVRHQTGQRIISDAWAIPVTQTSTIARTGRDRDYTWIAASSSWRLAETAFGWHSTYGVVTQINDLGDTATTADDVCTRLSYVPNTTGG